MFAALGQPRVLIGLLLTLAAGCLLVAVIGDGSQRPVGLIGFVVFTGAGVTWILAQRGGPVSLSLIGAATVFVVAVVLAFYPEALGGAPEMRYFWGACAVLIGLGLANSARHLGRWGGGG